MLYGCELWHLNRNAVSDLEKEKRTQYEVKAGDAVIIKTDDKNREKWPLAIVERLFPGPDRVKRAVHLRTKNSLLEIRPV